MKLWLSITFLMLASACNQQPAGNNASTVANAIAPVATPDKCAPPEILDAPSGTRLAPEMFAATKVNFATALARACKKGQLDKRPLLDPDAVDPGRLFLFNAPEANVASIYQSEANGNRMVLEFPFLTTDGEARVPTADELEEALHCNLVGATPEEQEKDGRCLPD